MPSPDYWLLRYRLNSDVKKTGRFNTPWFDVAKYFDYAEANDICNKMIESFSETAEWSLIEVWD